MKLPKYIKNKIQQVMDLRSKAAELEQDLYAWLNEKGFDTSSDDFMDTVGDKLCYSEATVEEIESLLDEVKR